MGAPETDLLLSDLAAAHLLAESPSRTLKFLETLFRKTETSFVLVGHQGSFGVGINDG